MTPVLDARAARRRFVLINALTWLPQGLGLPTMVLLMQVRGVDLAGVGLAFAVYGIAVALLELPTGGLADVIGRRTVLAASAAVTVAATAWMAVADALWMFIAVSLLKALARALSSGPAEAWYVDAAHAAEADAGELRRGLAQGHSAGSAALAIGTLVGGGLPLLIAVTSLLPEHGVLVPLSIPMLLAAVAGAALLTVALLGMPEPGRAAQRPRLGAVLADVPATVARGARLGVRNRLLSRVLLTAAGLGIALNAIELLTPTRLADLTGDPAAGATGYAVVAAIGFAAVSVGSGLGPRVSRLARGAGDTTPGRTAAAGGAIAALALGGLAASAVLDGLAGIVAAALAYTGMFLGLGIAGPARSELLHSRASAQERATVLSIDSLLLQAGGAVSALALGAVAARWSVAPAWWIGAAVLLAAALLFPLRPPHPHPRPGPGPGPGSRGDQGIPHATRRYDTQESLDQPGEAVGPGEVGGQVGGARRAALTTDGM